VEQVNICNKCFFNRGNDRFYYLNAEEVTDQRKLSPLKSSFNN